VRNYKDVTYNKKSVRINSQRKRARQRPIQSGLEVDEVSGKGVYSSRAGQAEDTREQHGRRNGVEGQETLARPLGHVLHTKPSHTAHGMDSLGWRILWFGRGVRVGASTHRGFWS